LKQLAKVKNALLGLLLAPFYILLEREHDKKMQEK
jgi:hypothetical protein